MKIYIIDDHKLVAEGIAKLLESVDSVTSAEVFTNSDRLYQAINQSMPDLVFIDLIIDEEDGRRILQTLKVSYPSLPCFILSMINEKHIIEDCIEKGATGFLCKDCDFEDLKNVLKNPFDYFLSKEALKTLLGKSKSGKFKLLSSLTEKEKQVLTMLCDGFSPKEIGEQLFLSTRTIETHKTNAMVKFNVNSVSKLISLAIKHKVI